MDDENPAVAVDAYDDRRPMFRTNVVNTAAGWRPQVWADLRLESNYTLLVWEGEPVSDHAAATACADEHITDAVRRLFYGGNVARAEMKLPDEPATAPAG